MQAVAGELLSGAATAAAAAAGSGGGGAAPQEVTRLALVKLLEGTVLLLSDEHAPSLPGAPRHAYTRTRPCSARGRRSSPPGRGGGQHHAEAC